MRRLLLITTEQRQLTLIHNESAAMVAACFTEPQTLAPRTTALLGWGCSAQARRGP